MSSIISIAQKISEYDDAVKLDECLDYIPLAEIFESAAQDQENSARDEGDRVVIALLKWFKSHFKWVNAAPCAHCGNTETVGRGGTSPNEEEKKYGTQVTEVWHCDKCNSDTRFPRYNDLYKLLETESGRCGEWCHVMTYLLKSLGKDVRYIWNSEDHVWNEVWSDNEKRWIHVDSCEAAFDKPLIYADGWGKKMAYVIAVSNQGCKDVTNRYVRRPDAALPRKLMSEQQLAGLLAQLTTNARAGMDPVELVNQSILDEEEDKELNSFVHAPTATESLQARQSGSAEWTASRGENGA